MVNRATYTTLLITQYLFRGVTLVTLGELLVECQRLIIIE